MLRSVVLALLGVSSACGWFTATLPKTRMPLKMSSSPDAPLESEDPCWQDLYDDDCSMSSIYSASFVAGKWIKSMPCASSLDEDCDMGDLDVPEIRQEGGMDHVDVMGFLGLKKVENISAKKKNEGGDTSTLSP